MKAKMATYMFVFVFLCVDMCVVMLFGSTRLSPLLSPHSFTTLWIGGLLRFVSLLLVTFLSSSSPMWPRSANGVQTVAVHSLVYPVYVTLRWVCGWSTLELTWGWHTWQGLLQSYAVSALSLLLWERYVSSVLTKKKVEPEEKSQATLQRLLGYMKPYWGRFTVVFLLVVLSSVGEMAIPHYTGKITDWILKEDEPDAFANAIKIMSILTVMSAVFEFVCDLIYNTTMSLIHTAIQSQVFESVLKQEIAFFDERTSGELVSRITKDTNDMSESLNGDLSLLMWYTMRLVFLYGSMMLLSCRLSFLTLLGLPVIWIVPEFSGKFYQKHAVKVQKSLANSNSVATETFSSIKTVKSFANELGESERYRKCLEHTYSLNKVEAAAYAASTWTNSMSSLALKVSILYYGGQLVAGDIVSSGDLVSFVLFELQFSDAVQSVMSCYPRVKTAVGKSEKIFEYVDRKPDVLPEGSLAPETFRGHVLFNNITFAYPTRPDENVLKGVSLELKPGEVTALVGPADSGKSTVVRLLERFYRPKEGEILLDGYPLKDYKDQYLHEKISVVAQEPILFARSIRENIKYGKADASDEEMTDAAKQANAHKFISDFPKGYDTNAGEKGDGVSGGQKQRIAIARALIRKPKILILDDSTSDLDAESEHMVHQALLKKSNGRSVLLITNKLSGVMMANHVVFLHKGEVLEQGSHESLQERDGPYAKFVRLQNTSFSRNPQKNS
ncbi:Antigen peptide transporter 1 [Bagarius yarrelli]|uniref:Antigen peptide transporter 1 n=1 Tax=Bagarius yarrelli TaxID=175774 RepID=A0A556TLV5_BAGYA|nr:Antigen peptide transporter 1 [Bagarius yarrelli]